MSDLELQEDRFHEQTETNIHSETIPWLQDFREVIGGMRGVIHWNKIFDGSLQGWSFEGKPIETDTMPAGWSIVGENGLVGEEWKAGTTLNYGEPSWRDLELSLLITPLGGGNAQVLFRNENCRAAQPISSFHTENCF